MFTFFPFLSVSIHQFFSEAELVDMSIYKGLLMPTGSARNSSLLNNIFREVYLLIAKSSTAARGHVNIFLRSSYQLVVATLLNAVASRRFKILLTVKGNTYP